MFDFLKKKLSKLVDNLSKKVEKKEREQENEAEEIEKAIDKKVDVIEAELSTEPSKAIEEIKKAIEEKAPEKRREAEEIAKEIKAELSGPAEKMPIVEKAGSAEHKKKEPLKEVTPSIETKRPEEKRPVMEKAEPIMHKKTAEFLEAAPRVEIKKPEEKKSWIKRISEKIVKRIVEKKLGEDDLKPLLEELEADLIESDVALEVVEKIEKDLKAALVDREIERGRERETIRSSIRQSLTDVLTLPGIDLKRMPESKKPVIVLFLGFNGNGKTSTIAKVANWLKGSGHSCVISASDCFRAAAIDQIEEHARKLGIKLIKHDYGADPAAVAFDAISHAKANGLDFVLIDTAGRTHTNVNLMKEMEKIVRVSKPDLKVLVIDSLVGNDAVSQAKTFNETIGIDAVIFTKVDINPKGGAILSVSYLLKKPVLFLSVGQEYSDLKEFDRDWFIGQLVGNG